MPTETFAAARVRLLRELEAMGWQTRPALKVPWAVSPNGQAKLWFKPQAVYLNEHSLFLDIRGLSAIRLVEYVNRALAYGNAQATHRTSHVRSIIRRR